MYALTEEQFKAEAEPIFRQVFATYDPEADDNIFTPQIVSRKIIFPCYGSVEPPELMLAIINAAIDLGDKGCYVFVARRNYCNKPNHCYVTLAKNTCFLGECATRFKMDIVSDYFIYSAQGQWGIAVTGAQYGLLGGSREFINRIADKFPGLDEQIYEFFKYWKEDKEDAISRGFIDSNHQVKWIPMLLNHIYGEEVAENLLRGTGLP